MEISKLSDSKPKMSRLKTQLEKFSGFLHLYYIVHANIDFFIQQTKSSMVAKRYIQFQLKKCLDAFSILSSLFHVAHWIFFRFFFIFHSFMLCKSHIFCRYVSVEKNKSHRYIKKVWCAKVNWRDTEWWRFV